MNSMKLINMKKINIKDLISYILPVEEAAKGFEIVEKKEGLKVVIRI